VREKGRENREKMLFIFFIFFVQEHLLAEYFRQKVVYVSFLFTGGNFRQKVCH
jgi:hypothetical protein